MLNVMAVDLFRSVVFMTLTAVLFASASVPASTSTLNDELLLIDQKLSVANTQLSEAAIQMRDAKQNATDKQIELERLQAAHTQKPDSVDARELRHTKQRLALAKMSVGTASARFARIQRHMEDLATARIQLLASRDNQLVTSDTELDHSARSERASKSTSAKQPQAAVVSGTIKGVNKGYTAEKLSPILSTHGKLTDPLAIEDELQKLEQHLVTSAAPQKEAKHVKVFGSTIEGELMLLELGANQFFARFVATQAQTRLIVGARFDEYLRTAMDLEFTDEEIGQEFVLIFDANQITDRRAIVFQSDLLPSKEVFAAYQQP